MMSISEHQDDCLVYELRIIYLMVIIKAKLAYALVWGLFCRVSVSKLFFPDTALIIVAPAFFLDSGTYQVVTRSATGGFQAFFPN